MSRFFFSGLDRNIYRFSVFVFKHYVKLYTLFAGYLSSRVDYLSGCLEILTSYLRYLSDENLDNLAFYTAFLDVMSILLHECLNSLSCLHKISQIFLMVT